MSIRKESIKEIEKNWLENPRWKDIKRGYSAYDIDRLRGTIKIEYTLAKKGAEKLWYLLNNEPFISCLSAVTGGQAMQQVKAGLKSIYVSGWQVAADNNTYYSMYPDQSLYPVNSTPFVTESINNSFIRADEIQHARGIEKVEQGYIDYFAPIVADAEAGFGGILNSFELMKFMIKSGVAGVHFEDQLSSAKKCGHMGGKVLIPTKEAVEKLISARLASDILGVPTLLFARTDANSANLLTSDSDPYDKKFLTGERSVEGFYYVKPGIEQAIHRALAYAPYADLLWCETATPDLNEAKYFAKSVHDKFPNKLLAYNCSPSFNWKKNLDIVTINKFQNELGAMGYKYQFITLSGIHSMWYNMFDLAHDYCNRGMIAYVEKVQEPEFASRARGYTFVSHQQEVGTGYFDDLSTVIQGGKSSVTALTGSTEEKQF